MAERNDIVKRIDRSNKVRTGFHQAKWDEPIIYELSTPGERGILVGEPEKTVAAEVEGVAAIPAGMTRTTKLNLPEMSQHRVLRHYARLAQQNPERAEKLFAEAEEAAKAKYDRLTKMGKLYE